MAQPPSSGGGGPSGDSTTPPNAPPGNTIDLASTEESPTDALTGSGDLASGGSTDRPTEEKEKGGFVSKLSQYASLITAALAIFAAVATLSTPADLRAGMRSVVGLRYRVEITYPTDRDHFSCPVTRARRKAPKPVIVTAKGTAKLPPDWHLFIFLQAPDQLRYYIAGAAATTVSDDGSWSVDLQIGSAYPEDCNEPYKIYAILATREGQRDLLEGLKDLDTGSPWLPALPHHGPEAIADVTLR
jgi:hypothetical protein